MFLYGKVLPLVIHLAILLRIISSKFFWSTKLYFDDIFLLCCNRFSIWSELIFAQLCKEWCHTIAWTNSHWDFRWERPIDPQLIQDIIVNPLSCSTKLESKTLLLMSLHIFFILFGEILLELTWESPQT